MFAAKNKHLKNNYEFENFLTMRLQHETIVEQLEQDVYKYLNNNPEELPTPPNEVKYMESRDLVFWEFVLKEFSPKNIIIQVKKNYVHLYAYKTVLREGFKKDMLIPDHVDTSKIAATMTSKGVLTISVPIITPLSDME
ncbi:hypothetical protein KR009_004971 [Drosophila setifemur]|nr:hypothetical protein KR009_004971 [Drosophila setifemur]